MSYKYRYSLNKENMADLQLEAAYSDKALKKKMIILLINFLFIPTAIVVILMKNKIIALFIAVIYFFVCLFIFPTVYWNRIRKVINMELAKTDFKFDELIVEFTEESITVEQKSRKFFVSYDQVEGYKITNHNFMVIYHEGKRDDCLVLPYLIVKNELDSIVELIKAKKEGLK